MQIEDMIKEAVLNAIGDIGVDLVSDMVHSNTDWWANQVVKVLEPSLKKALEDKADRLLKEILEEVVKEHCDNNLVESLAQTIVETKLQCLEVNVEVKQ